MKVLFFSRGRGRGHAMPDASIANELLKADPELEISFVSYAMGAETLRQSGYAVLDLELPEDNPFLETLAKSVGIINVEEPSLILSHEEFCVPVAAKLFDIPCVFLIDWFPPEGSLWTDSLSYASHLIFLDDPGYYDQPKSLPRAPAYVGPVVREMKYRKADRQTARETLGLPENGLVILVLPGGSSASSEEKSPLFALVQEAVELLGGASTVMWVVSADEEKKMMGVGTGNTNTIFMRPHLDIDRTIVASDLVITKATRNTAFELSSLGIPSISVSFGLNPVDDHRVPQITTRALRARGLSGASFAQHIKEVLAAALPMGCSLTDDWTRGRTGVVAELRRHIQDVKHGSKSADLES